jgi:hypothetical protein
VAETPLLAAREQRQEELADKQHVLTRQVEIAFDDHAHQVRDVFAIARESGKHVDRRRVNPR